MEKYMFASTPMCVWDKHYHLFVWFHLSPLALSCFLDVFGRQPSNCGRVLMVAPEVTDLMLTVWLSPQMPVQTVVVETVMSNEMSATTIAKLITSTLQTPAKKCILYVTIETIYTWHLGGKIWCFH